MKDKISIFENSSYWIISIIALKFLSFYFFHNQFQQNVIGMESWLAITPDTNAYYEPIRNWVNGFGYGNACRMPGLLPIYAPLYYLFGELWSNNLITIIQLICSTISLFLLAKTSKYFFPKVSPSIVVLLYLSTPFISIYDHYGLSDSFSVSWMILGCYFFTQFRLETKTKKKYLYIILCAFFLIWASYMRQFNFFIFGMFGLLLLSDWIRKEKGIKPYVVTYSITAFLLILPWWLYNVKNDRPKIIFVEPINNCFDGYPEYQLELRKLPMAWGGKFMVWGKEAEWFLRKTMEESEFPFSEQVFTSQYNLDSLKILRKKSLEIFYGEVQTDNENLEKKKKYIIDKSKLYLKSYKEEHPLDYYIFNKLKLLRKFLFSKEIVLPFPPLEKMELYHIIIKILALLTTSYILILGLLNSLFKTNSKQKFLATVIWVYIFIIVCYMGYIEYRYWETIFPFIVLFCADVSQRFIKFLNCKLQKSF